MAVPSMSRAPPSCEAGPWNPTLPTKWTAVYRGIVLSIPDCSPH